MATAVVFEINTAYEAEDVIVIDLFELGRGKCSSQGYNICIVTTQVLGFQVNLLKIHRKTFGNRTGTKSSFVRVEI